MIDIAAGLSGIVGWFFEYNLHNFAGLVFIGKIMIKLDRGLTKVQGKVCSMESSVKDHKGQMFFLGRRQEATDQAVVRLQTLIEK